MNTDLRQRMQDIVDNCVGEEPAYCQAACPMHTDVKGYVNLIAEGRFTEALALIREQLIMPAVLGRVCAHPCEQACKRNELESAMSVAALKRFVADNYDTPEQWDTFIEDDREERVAVVGAGPAGAQAAFELAKKGYKVTVLEKLPVVGGMLYVGIPAYRLPREIIEFEYTILEKLGVEIRLGVNVGTDITFEELRREYDGVVLAVGAHEGKVLPIDGHEADGVVNAVDMLREVSLEGSFKGLGVRTAVIGGGDVAIDAARSAVRLGARTVTILYRRSEGEMPADPEEIADARAEGIEILTLRNPNRIVADEAGRVTAIEVGKCRLGEPDESGRRRPIPLEGCPDEVTEVHPVDSVIFACGQNVDCSCAPELDTAKGGQFTVDEVTLQTCFPNVVVAGDATGHSAIAVEAMAEGRKAAITLDRLFKGSDLKADRETERAYASRLQTDIPEDAPRRPRAETRKRDPEERVADFAEYDFGLSEEQAVCEASGCLGCECLQCVKECEMLADFTSCPKELFEELLDAEDVPPEIPYSCNMCQQCTLACPQDFDMRSIFGGIRRELVDRNRGKSPMKGHGVIYMHQRLGFSKPFNTTLPAPDGETKRVFIPGCSLPSHNPEAVDGIYRHLQERLGNTGTILKCCGKPTKALGQYEKFTERYAQLQAEIDRLGAEEIIVACQSCYVTMKQYSPNQKVTSLWELMPQIGLPEGTAGKGRESDITFAIHDSCPTRDVPEIHEGIRWMLDELGYPTEEPANSRENTRCCGFGGMVVPANPDLAKRVMARRTGEVESDHMVTYCAACRESMVQGGKEAAHILDLVFESVKTEESEFAGLPGSPIGPWAKRFRAKKLLEAARSELRKQNRRAVTV